MAGGTSGGNERSLEQTPTWAVVVVCSAFVIVSLLIEQAIHHVGTVRFCQLLLSIFIFIFHCQRILLLIVFGIQQKHTALFDSRSMHYWICSQEHIIP